MTVLRFDLPDGRYVETHVPDWKTLAAFQRAREALERGCHPRVPDMRRIQRYLEESEIEHGGIRRAAG